MCVQVTTYRENDDEHHLIDLWICMTQFMRKYHNEQSIIQQWLCRKSDLILEKANILISIILTKDIFIPDKKKKSQGNSYADRTNTNYPKKKKWDWKKRFLFCLHKNSFFCLNRFGLCHSPSDEQKTHTHSLHPLLSWMISCYVCSENKDQVLLVLIFKNGI
jgi:hypothetical protein